MESIKKVLKEEIVFSILFVIIALHPIIELDYLFYGIIDIPRLTTIIDYLILPLIVLLVFIFYERDKKRIIIFLIYALVFGAYFGVHCVSAMNLQRNIHLTENFIFTLKDEVLYTIVLLLPLIYVFFSKHMTITEEMLKKISVFLSASISFPILISDIFLFGRSTYAGMTYDNIFSWFTLPFDERLFHPRRYACKFFFEEGNAIGILLLLVLPLMYYFLYKEKDTIKKILLYICVFVQSISMIILSTRLSTYGSALIPFVVLTVYIVLCLLKIEKIRKTFIFVLLINTIICGVIIPFSPAYQNQKIDASDYGIIKADDDQLESARGLLKDADKLIKWTKEWRDFYVYMFEDYQFLINVTPPIYYSEWYSYKHDPEFWVDVIFDYPLEERVNGRQIETIFTKYKWNELTTTKKLTGFGYSTFMNGGILIERDFVQQYYSYGPVGAILIFGVWIFYLIYAIIKVLFGFKNGKWTFINITLLMSICLGFVCSIVSGHTFDELTTSMFISLLMSFLLKEVNVGDPQ